MLLTRSLSFAPATLDREARTVEVVAISGPAPVVRTTPAPDGARAPWVEEMDPAGADLAAFEGAPVLRDHKATTEHLVGTVESARLEGGQVVARVRFGTNAAANEIFDAVASGILRGVSVGYVARRWAAAGERGGRKVWRAVSLSLRELSFTPLPADAGATVRTEESNMPDLATETTTDAPAAIPTMTRAAVNAEIRSIARAANLPATWADARIDEEADLSAVRAAALEELKKRSAPNIQTATVQVLADHGDPVATRSAMADALAFRVAPDRAKLEGRAREFVEWTVLDMVAELARSRGTPLDARNRITVADAIFTRSHSTSDFPLLLEAAANKTLMGAYQTAAPTFTRWCGTRSFTDFKPHKFLRLGDFPAMQEIEAEGGEVQFGTISEGRETIAAKEWATGIKINRRALINDDLGALGDFTGMAGRRIAYDQNAKMYDLLQSNSGAGPALADGKGVFHVDHGNVATAGAIINETSVAGGVIAMGDQTTLDGLRMNLRPSLIVCGPRMEIAARKLVAAITPNQTSAVNVYAGAFEVLVDANITGNRWFLFADPAAAPVFVHGYVSAGQAGPTARSEIDFDTLAVKLRVGMDWGYGAIDFRGVYTNPGAQ